MTRRRGTKGATLGAAALSTIVLPAGAAEAQKDPTEVRFLHAVSGASPASLRVEPGQPQLPSAFAKPSGYKVYSPGTVRLALILDGESSPIVTERVRLGPGRHTVVAVKDRGGVDLLVYRDNGLAPGKATIRAVHTASEVGRADVRVDGKVVATSVGLGDSTDYLPVPPGRHTLAVTRPGGKGGPLVEGTANAVAGTSSTAWVVGSAGMPAQLVLTSDDTVGPTAAPATGIGPSDSGSWLLVIGSSLIGGSLGGLSYTLVRRRRAGKVVAASAPAATPSRSSVMAGPPVAPKQETAKNETPAVTAASPAPVAAMAATNGHANGTSASSVTSPDAPSTPPEPVWTPAAAPDPLHAPLTLPAPVESTVPAAPEASVMPEPAEAPEPVVAEPVTESVSPAGATPEPSPEPVAEPAPQPTTTFAPFVEPSPEPEAPAETIPTAAPADTIESEAVPEPSPVLEPAASEPEPVVVPEPIEAPDPIEEPEPVAAEPVPPAGQATPPPASTWTAPTRAASSSHASQGVTKLVVSGAALVITGLVVARRRGGR